MHACMRKRTNVRVCVVCVFEHAQAGVRKSACVCVQVCVNVRVYA